MYPGFISLYREDMGLGTRLHGEAFASEGVFKGAVFYYMSIDVNERNVLDY